MSADRRSRVLVVSTSFPLRPGASAGVFVQRMVQAYATRLQAEVLCPDDSLPRPPTPGIHAFRYAPKAWQRLAQSAGGVMPALRRAPGLALLLPAFLIAMAWHAWRMARTTDVVHGNWAICGAIVGPIARWRNIPSVVTLRGSDVSLAGNSVLQAWLLRRAVRANARVVCVSEAMAEQVRRLHPADAVKISAIANGVGDDFLALPVPSQRTVEGPLRLLSIGSLVPGKGFDVLLEALSLLGDHDWQLQVIGEGPELDPLTQRATVLAINDRIQFLGSVVPDRIAAAFSRSDVFVLASRSEGRSNVILEAMGAAMPIVASRIPGIADVVEDATQAWLVPPGDPVALADALRSCMLDSELRRQRGAAARQRILGDGGSWEGTGNAYADLFEGIIERRQGQG